MTGISERAEYVRNFLLYSPQQSFELKTNYSWANRVCRCFMFITLKSASWWWHLKKTHFYDILQNSPNLRIEWTPNTGHESISESTASNCVFSLITRQMQSHQNICNISHIINEFDQIMSGNNKSELRLHQPQAICSFKYKLLQATQMKNENL